MYLSALSAIITSDVITAEEEAGTFFKRTPPPVVVDEIQYAPNLFPYTKMIADKEGRNGRFYLTGSQQSHMMKKVGESLAGRIGILDLLGLSLREIHSLDFTLPFRSSPFSSVKSPPTTGM